MPSLFESVPVLACLQAIVCLCCLVRHLPARRFSTKGEPLAIYHYATQPPSLHAIYCEDVLAEAIRWEALRSPVVQPGASANALAGVCGAAGKDMGHSIILAVVFV